MTAAEEVKEETGLETRFIATGVRNLGAENVKEGKIEINEKDRKEMSSRQSALAAAYVPQSCEAGFYLCLQGLFGRVRRGLLFGFFGKIDRNNFFRVG